MVNNKSKSDRCKLVWKKTNGVCAHCGNPASNRTRTVDHYVPRSGGGGYDIRNLMPLCKSCNVSRENFKIDPYQYYKFAPRAVIDQCVAYEKEFDDSHRSMGGTVY